MKVEIFYGISNLIVQKNINIFLQAEPNIKIKYILQSETCCDNEDFYNLTISIFYE